MMLAMARKRMLWWYFTCGFFMEWGKGRGRRWELEGRVREGRGEGGEGGG